MADLTITINPPNTNTITISDGVLPHNSTHAPSGNDSLESWYAKTSDLAYVSGQIGAPSGVVLITGNQEIGGVKNFSSRPTVNGSGVMLTGETPGTGYLTGYVGKSETGSFVTSGNTGNFVDSSQTGQLTGTFYPYSANPAAYVQGAVVRPSNTGIFIDTSSIQTISGQKNFNSGILVGVNSMSGTGNSVLGGSGNSVSGRNSSIGGGVKNFAGPINTFIGGGSGNMASGSGGAVVGGQLNRILSTAGSENFIGGGFGNQIAAGSYNSILGGYSNVINISDAGDKNFIVGGDTNSIRNANKSFVVGGEDSSIFSNGTRLERAFVVGSDGYVEHSYAAVITDGLGSQYSSGEKTLVVKFTSGIHLKGPTTFNSRPTFNGTGFLLSGEASAATTGYLTGYVQKTETGTFYSTSNPSGYITGVDLSPYATTSSATGISGYLQTQITSNNQTGAFLTTGDGDVRYYPLSSNPSSYLVASDVANLASTGYVTGVSGYLQGQISTLNGQTGTYATGSIVRPSETGSFLTTGAADSRYLTSASGFNSRTVSTFTTGVISGFGGTVFSVYQNGSALPMASGFAGLSGNITPINASSKIRVKVAAQVSAATNIFFGVALARSGDANAKVQTCVQTARSDITYPIFLEYEEVAGTTGRIDYITRWGPQSNNAFFTGYWNKAAAGNSFGLGSSMEIIEILP